MEVGVAELRRAATWWDAHAGDLVEGVRGEIDAAETTRARQVSAPKWTQLTGSPLPVPVPVPAWLDELDDEWQRRRAQLVSAGHQAGAALDATAGSYLTADAYLAAAMIDGDAVPGIDQITHPHGTNDAAVDEALDAAAGRNGAAATASSVPVHPSPTEIDAAVALWRVRAETTTAVVGDLDRAVTATWIGAAGDAYRQWVDAHRDRWSALAQDADRIHHTLADHMLPAAPGGRPRPVAGAPSLAPTRAGPMPSDAPVTPSPDRLPATPDAEDRDHLDDHKVYCDDGARFGTDNGTANGTGEGVDDSTDNSAGPGAGPGAGSSVISTSPGDRSDLLWRGLDTYLPGDADFTAQVEPANAGPADARQSPAPDHLHVHDAADDGRGSIDVRADSSNGDIHFTSANLGNANLDDSNLGADVGLTADLPAPPPVVVINNEGRGATDVAIAAGAASSAAAAAAIAALAQQDRAVHVIGSLGPPPPATPAVPAPAAPAAPPVIGPTQPTTPPPPAAPGPSPAPSWGRIALDGLSSAVHPLPPAAPASAATRAANRTSVPMSRHCGSAGQPRRPEDDPTRPIPVVPVRRARPTPILVPIGVGGPTPHGAHGRPADRIDGEAAGRAGVLVDLAVTGGMGLHGPGAAAVARTILARLLTQPGAAPRIVLPAAVAGRLLENADPPDSAGCLVLTDGPFNALARLDDEIAHRRAQPSSRPFVLILPAPRDDRTTEQLRTQVTDAETLTCAVVLLGAWPLGTTIHIDDNHTVTRHIAGEAVPTSAADAGPVNRPGGDLLGQRLTPTTAAELHTHLHAHPADATPTATTEPPAEPQPVSIDDAPDREPAITTPAPNTDPDPVISAGTDQNHTDQTDTDRAASATPTGDVEISQPEQHAEPVTVATQEDADADRDEIDEPTGDGPGTGAGDRAPVAPLVLRVLGDITLHLRTDPTDPDIEQELPLTGRAQAVLAYLAARPGRGATRPDLVATLWPDSKATRTESALHTTLTQLRKIARDTSGIEDIIPIELRAKHYRITDSVEVDYWNYLPAAKAVMDTPSAPDHAAAERVVSLYRGPYATGYHGDWLDKIRTKVTRLYLTAIWRLVSLVADSDPDRAISLLEKARDHEEDNNFIYYNIMRLHYQAGRYDDAAAAYDHLCTVLDDLSAKPDAPTRALAIQVQRARTAPS